MEEANEKQDFNKAFINSNFYFDSLNDIENLTTIKNVIKQQPQSLTTASNFQNITLIDNNTIKAVTSANDNNICERILYFFILFKLLKNVCK